MTATPPAEYPPFKSALWPMVLLFLAANIYSIDKNIVGVLAEPIRHSFAIGDQQMSLLLGLAYSVLSGVLGLGLGWLVDHRTRRMVLAGSLTLWSVATMACGLAPGFASFFVFRALVGLGEAALAPAALSLIADLFPPGQRGRALSSYLIGASIGSGLSSVVPGWIIGADLHLWLPFYGTVEPWRAAFVLCGAAGPVIGLLFLTVREPARHGFAADGAGGIGLGAKLASLWAMRWPLLPLFAGFCLFYVALIGITSWTATFLGRHFLLSVPQFAPQMGLMLLVSGMGGYIISGFVADAAPMRRPGGRIALLAVLPLLALPSAFAGFAGGLNGALMLLAAIGTVMPIINVATNATVQDVVPNAMRGFAYATLGLLSAIVAGTGGPWAVAFVSTHVAADPARIGLGFLYVGLPALLLASACFALAWAQARGGAITPERQFP
ncbi:MFS transporter [Novosphingobium sp. FSY-8]|uniref:MFS transporter n=1 Tax=Novosphingobium ovatum TaxID=1908523 RepID=A0ABW9XA14_9SPHN|nr:MFS transporter [Novosphingobium ovatum]NBC35361.1 MFS transporter [Novosphingobium ovatum]